MSSRVGDIEIDQASPIIITVHRKSELNIEEDSEYESTTDPVNLQNYDDLPEDYPLVSERAGHGDHSVSLMTRKRRHRSNN